MKEKKPFSEELMSEKPAEIISSERLSYVARRRMTEESKRKKTSLFPKWQFLAGTLVIIVYMVATSYPALKNLLLPSTEKNSFRLASDKTEVKIALDNFNNNLTGELKGKNRILAIKANYEPYLLVLSVDENGLITKHFPLTPLKAVKLEAEKELLLPIKKFLKDAPQNEKIFVFASRNELKETYILQELNKGFLQKKEELCSLKSFNQIECRSLLISWQN